MKFHPPRPLEGIKPELKYMVLLSESGQGVELKIFLKGAIKVSLKIEDASCFLLGINNLVKLMDLFCTPVLSKIRFLNLQNMS